MIEYSVSRRSQPIEIRSLHRQRGSVGWTVDAENAVAEQRTLRARVLLYVSLATLLALLYWASVAVLDEVTRGQARVVPSTQLQVIQSFDGGVVTDILVREGDLVQPGDTLVRIDPVRFEATLRESQAELLSLTATAARLNALLDGIPLELPPQIQQLAPELAMREFRLFQSVRDELSERKLSANERLNQRAEELSEARARRGQLVRRLESVRNELAINRTLIASRAVAEVDIIRLEREVSSLEGDLDQVDAQIRRLISAQSEAELAVNELESNARLEWQRTLADTENRLSSVQEQLAGRADRVRLTEILAPVRGIVQRLHVTTQGGVIQPGREVLDLVPIDDQLIVEARIAPQDIAFLRLSQPAVVKMSAYDFNIFGGFPGEVVHISADSIIQDNGDSYYLVRIEIERTERTRELEILPGMTAQVDILTGKRTVLDYLLKPVLRAREYALTER